MSGSPEGRALQANGPAHAKAKVSSYEESSAAGTQREDRNDCRDWTHRKRAQIFSSVVQAQLASFIFPKPLENPARHCLCPRKKAWFRGLRNLDFSYSGVLTSLRNS